MFGTRHRFASPAGLVVLWCAVLALTVAAAGKDVLPGDLRVARRVQTWDGPVADAVAAYGNWIGHYWVGVVISLPVVTGLAWLRRRREIALLVAILLVRALNSTIKELIDSPRPTPDLIRVTEEAAGLGFPSGHASGVVLHFGALIVIGHRLRLPGILQAGLWVAELGTIVATGFGRVYVGAHWPSDVVGGFLLGFAVLLTLLWGIGLLLPLQEGVSTNPGLRARAIQTKLSQG